MTDQQTDRRAVRAQQRDAARSQGAADVDAMTLQVDRALGAIRSDGFWTDILAALPISMNRESFRQIATTAIMSDPRLLSAERRSLAIELMFCARMGLMPGGYGEIALFADGTGKVQHRTEYGGILKLAHNSGMVASADAVAVYRGEVCKLSPTKEPVHEYSLEERGEWLGCYAYVERQNGRWQVEWMTVKEIRAHAQRYSEALRQKRQTPWNDPEAEIEMGNKTVLRRLLKYVPKSPEVAAVLAHEDELDRALFAKDVTGQRQQALTAPQTASAPRGWQPQFSGGGNGHAEEHGQEAPPGPAGDAPSSPEPPARPAAPSPAGAAPAAEQPARRPGRPKKPETVEREQATVARQIIAEIGSTDPEYVSDYLAERAAEIDALSAEWQGEIRAAARKREGAEPDPVRHDPETGEIEDGDGDPLAGQGDQAQDPDDSAALEDDDFEVWRQEMTVDMSGRPREFLVGAKANWLKSQPFGERGAAAVQAAFDAAQRR